MKLAVLITSLFIAATCLSACGGRGALPAPPTAPGAPGAPSPSSTPAATLSITLFSVPSGINHITFSTDGKLWFTTNNQYASGATVSVGFLDPATGNTQVFGAIAAGESAYSVPDQITAGASGSVWYDVNWFGFGCPQPCTKASAMINAVTESGQITPYATNMAPGAGVFDLLLSADGHVYALGSAVLQFTTGQTSGPSAAYPGPATQGTPYVTLNRGLGGALAIATSGTLYNFVSGSFSTIGTIGNGGVCGVALAGSAYWINQSYVTSNAGNTGTWSSNILRLTTAGATSSYAMPSSGVVTCSSINQGQDQVVISPSGSIYYPENNADKIGRFNPATAVSTELNPEIGPTMGVAIDASGNVWAAGINGKIAEIKGF
jgi:hypothetical protein